MDDEFPATMSYNHLTSSGPFEPIAGEVSPLV